MAHIPVLLQEVIEGLQIRNGDFVLDATVGGGGHSEALCRAIGKDTQRPSSYPRGSRLSRAGLTTFICLDADEDAINRSRQRLEDCVRRQDCQDCNFLFERTNYRELDKALAGFGVRGINRVLFDLGLSSFQLEESGRGFSFMRDEPLEMTFEKNPEKSAVTAKTIVNEWSEETIATLLESYGDERHARSIARKIVEAREHTLISTTFQLASLVASVVRRRGRIHPATKTFQALRIAVNDEFQGLKDGISKAWEALLPMGRIAVISFQSLEDRLVKNFFRELNKTGAGKLINKKPIVPTEGELASNPRSRSAKLRIIENIKNI